MVQLARGEVSEYVQTKGPLEADLGDKSLQINTNPVEMHKGWWNQLERDTGEPAGLPYNVSREVDLQYEEVQKKLSRSINNVVMEEHEAEMFHVVNVIVTSPAIMNVQVECAPARE